MLPNQQYLESNRRPIWNLASDGAATGGLLLPEDDIYTDRLQPQNRSVISIPSSPSIYRTLAASSALWHARRARHHLALFKFVALRRRGRQFPGKSILYVLLRLCPPRFARINTSLWTTGMRSQYSSSGPPPSFFAFDFGVVSVVPFSKIKS